MISTSFILIGLINIIKGQNLQFESVNDKCLLKATWYWGQGGNNDVREFCSCPSGNRASPCVNTTTWTYSSLGALKIDYTEVPRGVLLEKCPNLVRDGCQDMKYEDLVIIDCGCPRCPCKTVGDYKFQEQIETRRYQSLLDQIPYQSKTCRLCRCVNASLTETRQDVSRLEWDCVSQFTTSQHPQPPGFTVATQGNNVDQYTTIKENPFDCSINSYIGYCYQQNNNNLDTSCGTNPCFYHVIKDRNTTAYNGNNNYDINGLCMNRRVDTNRAFRTDYIDIDRSSYDKGCDYGRLPEIFRQSAYGLYNLQPRIYEKAFGLGKHKADLQYTQYSFDCNADKMVKGLYNYSMYWSFCRNKPGCNQFDNRLNLTEYTNNDKLKTIVDMMMKYNTESSRGFNEYWYHTENSDTAKKYARYIANCDNDNTLRQIDPCSILRTRAERFNKFCSMYSTLHSYVNDEDDKTTISNQYWSRLQYGYTTIDGVRTERTLTRVNEWNGIYGCGVTVSTCFGASGIQQVSYAFSMLFVFFIVIYSM